MDSSQRIFTCHSCEEFCRAIDMTEPTGCLFPITPPRIIKPEWYVDELLTNILLHTEVD